MRRLLAVATALTLVCSGCDGGEEGPSGAAVETATSEATLQASRATSLTVAVDACRDEVAAMLERRADAVANAADGGGVVLGVVLPSGDVLSVGYTDRVTGLEVGADDRFHIGSITKIFTATVVLQLAEEGTVEIDAPAVDYLDGVDLDARVTVRDLLQHTSGIPNFAWDSNQLEAIYDHPERFWIPGEQLDYVDVSELDFEPGTSWTYSNVGYIILGLIIENVTGATAVSETRQRIFEPLGLNDTYFAGFEPEGGSVVIHYALDDADGDGLRDAVVDRQDPSAATFAWTAGGAVSSAADLTRFIAGLFSGVLLEPSSLTAMTEPRKGVSQPVDYYGLGIMQVRYPGGLAWGHGGNYDGFTSFLAHDPKLGISSVALLSTLGDEFGLGIQSLRLVARECHP